jgi:hypothetical protein
MGNEVAMADFNIPSWHCTRGIHMHIEHNVSVSFEMRVPSDKHLASYARLKPRMHRRASLHIRVQCSLLLPDLANIWKVSTNFMSNFVNIPSSISSSYMQPDTHDKSTRCISPLNQFIILYQVSNRLTSKYKTSCLFCDPSKI